MTRTHIQNIKLTRLQKRNNIGIGHLEELILQKIAEVFMRLRQNTTYLMKILQLLPAVDKMIYLHELQPFHLSASHLDTHGIWSRFVWCCKKQRTSKSYLPRMYLNNKVILGVAIYKATKPLVKVLLKLNIRSYHFLN